MLSEFLLVRWAKRDVFFLFGTTFVVPLLVGDVRSSQGVPDKTIYFEGISKGTELLCTIHFPSVFFLERSLTRELVSNTQP